MCHFSLHFTQKKTYSFSLISHHIEKIKLVGERLVIKKTKKAMLIN